MHGTGSMKTASNSVQNHPYVVMSDLRSPKGFISLQAMKKIKKSKRRKIRKWGKTVIPFFYFYIVYRLSVFRLSRERFLEQCFHKSRYIFMSKGLGFGACLFGK